MSNHPETHNTAASSGVPAHASHPATSANDHADNHGTVFASDFNPSPSTPQIPPIGTLPDSNPPTTSSTTPTARSSEKLCAVCGVDCSKKPRVRNADGRYACRSCFERTRLHRAAASVLTTQNAEAAGGTPAPEICSAIHQTLAGNREDDEIETPKVSRSVSPKIERKKPAPQIIQRSFFRRAIDAFLGRSADARSKHTHR